MFIKRMIDISLGVIIFAITAPFIFIILFIVLIVTKQIPFFLQERALTLEGKHIRVFKIRTHKSSPKISSNNQQDIFIKRDLQNSVPPFCRWLRKSGVDEILQLINVLKGEMSLIGPRPLTIEDLTLLQKDNPELYDRRKSILSKPGITCAWQVYGKRKEGFQNLIDCEEFYEKNKTIKFEIKILARTLLIFLSASHSDAIVM